MIDAYIVWFASAADMVRSMKHRPPSKILAIGFDADGRCHYVGLCRENGARYR